MDWTEKHDHFWTHNDEFRPHFASADAYEAAAVAFLTEAPGGSIMECTRRNGDLLRYDPVANVFAIVDRGGFVKTFYRPNPAIHKQTSNIEYFRGQCSK
jgi:pyocin large subunit-like protein